MRKFILAHIILFLGLTKVHAQNPAYIDSLKQALKTAKEDTTKVRLRAKIGEKTWLFRTTYWDSIVEDANRLGMLKTEANALNNIGFILKNSGESVKALEYFKRSIELHKKDKDPEAVAAGYNNLADAYYSLGQTEKALEFHSLSLKIKEREDFKDGIANSLNNIGLIYFDMGEGEKALEYHRQSFAIKKALASDDMGIGMSLNNLGLDHHLLGNKDSALHYFKLSLATHEENGYQPGVNLALNNIAGLLKRDHKYEEALDYYFRSLKAREAANERINLSQSYANICDVYWKMGNPQKAREFGEKAIEIAQEVNRPFDIEFGARILYKIYRDLGMYREAFEMHDLQVQMKDSLHNDKTKAAAVKSQLQYEYEKQMLSIEQEQEKKDLIRAQESKQQRIIISAIVVVLLLVLFFLYNLNKRFKVIRLQKETIEEQNQEIIDSINYAKRIQNAILPPNSLVREALPDSFVLYLPKDIVAGDFYWLEQKDGKTLFAAADCTGHGVPGAMVSVICNNGLNRSVREYGLTNPAAILNKTREIVIQEFEKSEEEVKDGMDIALCALQGNTLEYAGAHNPLWIIRKGADEIEEIKADKQPIGKYFKEGDFTNHAVSLNPGDLVYVFSDGYPDQFGGEKGKKLKSVNFKKLLLSISNQPMQQQHEALLKAFNDWKGDFEQLDDVCVIGIQV